MTPAPAPKHTHTHIKYENEQSYVNSKYPEMFGFAFYSISMELFYPLASLLVSVATISNEKKGKKKPAIISLHFLYWRKQANEAEELLSEWVVTWAATATTITTDRLSMKVFHLFSCFFFCVYRLESMMVSSGAWRTFMWVFLFHLELMLFCICYFCFTTIFFRTEFI